MSRRIRAPSHGGTNRHSNVVSENQSEASNHTPRTSSFSAAGSVILQENASGVYSAPTGPRHGLPRPVQTNADLTKAAAKLKESTSLSSGVKMVSEGEKTRRKLSAIVAGLRSKYWGARGSMSETFRKWDTDNSGFLDVGELREALTNMGYKTNEDETRALVAVFDNNGDGVVQYEDFVSLLCGDQKNSSALPASVKDSKFITSLGKSTMRAQDAGFALGDGEGKGSSSSTATGDTGYGSDCVSKNQGRAIRVWGGISMKKMLGTEEVEDVRGGALSDAAHGIGADVLRESIRRQSDRAESELRNLFTTDIVTRDEEVGGGGKGSPAAVQYTGECGPSLMQLKDAQQSEHEARQGHVAGWNARESLLLKTTVRARQAEFAAGDAIPSRAMDRSLHAHAHIPSARDPAPMSVVGSEAPSLHMLKGGLRYALPGGHAYDPLTATTATGDNTIVVGTVGYQPPLGVLNALVEKSVHRARMTGRMPLEGTFVGEGTDSGAIAAALGIQVDRSRAGSRRNSVVLPDHERASSRHAAASLRDTRLMGRTMGHLSRTRQDGGSGHDMPGYDPRHGAQGPLASPLRPHAQPAVPLAEQMARAKEDKMRRLGIETEKSLNAAAAGALAALQHSKAVKAERDRSAQTASREARVAYTPDVEEAEGKEGEGRGIMDAEMGRSVGPSRTATDITGGGVGNILDMTGVEVPTSGMVARMSRAEGARTTYLIAPPPGLLSDMTPEPPEWHYATATRLQQTQTPCPEQHFSRLARAESLANSRTGYSRWLSATVKAEDDAIAFRAADAAQRVERLKEERGRYITAIMARKGRLETALFGDPTQVQF